jgi:hypothetical protein
MAQTNFTPILLYASSTAAAVPLAANLTNSATGSEIAINIADKNLFFKDSGGVVNTVPIRQSSTSSNGWLSSTDWNTFNGKQAALVSGTNIKTVGGVSLLGSGDVGTIGIAYGGTGQTSFTAGYVHYGSFSTSANLFFDGTNLGIGTTSVTAGLLNLYTTSAATCRAIVQGTTNYALVQAKNTSGDFYFGIDNSAGSGFNAGAYGRILYSGGAYPMLFYTNDAERMRIFSSGGVSIGNTTDPGAGGLRVSGLIFPQQATTASAPAYVKGAIYFDTTLNKLRVGGATAWETITSV